MHTYPSGLRALPSKQVIAGSNPVVCSRRHSGSGFSPGYIKIRLENRPDAQIGLHYARSGGISLVQEHVSQCAGKDVVAPTGSGAPSEGYALGPMLKNEASLHAYSTPSQAPLAQKQSTRLLTGGSRWQNSRGVLTRVSHVAAFRFPGRSQLGPWLKGQHPGKPRAKHPGLDGYPNWQEGTVSNTVQSRFKSEAVYWCWHSIPPDHRAG